MSSFESFVESINVGGFLWWYICIIVVLFGLCVGSFLNVLVFRIPKKEDFVKLRSHCQSCNYNLMWYDNIPLLSYIFLKGRCRKCKKKISIQYPLVEGFNALLWLGVYLTYGISFETIIYCLLTSSLLALSIIDERIFKIPNQFNIFILILGIMMLVSDISNWHNYIIGALSVSGFLFLVYLITGGRGLGFGDVKLMFTCGLVVGWKMIIIGFLVGCIFAIIIHTIRMKLSNKTNKLAFGPYLSLGVYISLFIGELLMNAYLKVLGG